MTLNMGLRCCWRSASSFYDGLNEMNYCPGSSLLMDNLGLSEARDFHEMCLQVDFWEPWPLSF